MSAKRTLWKPAPMARSESQTRGSWSSLIIDDIPKSSVARTQFSSWLFSYGAYSPENSM